MKSSILENLGLGFASLVLTVMVGRACGLPSEGAAAATPAFVWPTAAELHQISADTAPSSLLVEPGSTTSELPPATPHRGHFVGPKMTTPDGGVLPPSAPFERVP